MRSSGRRIAAAALVAAAALAVLAAPPFYVHLATLALIFALLAASLNLLMGYAGLTSFGHAAYFGTAAYAAAVIVLRQHGGFWAALAMAVVAAAALGALFGLLASRSRGVYFLLITMALGQVIWGLAYRWVSLTGGDNGLPGVTRPAFAIIWPLADAHGYYLFTLIIVGIAIGLLAVIVASPFGYALRGIRESESRMRTLGYPVWGYTYVAFIISAMFAGVAGALYVFLNGFVSPAELHVSNSAQALLMVILGGSGTVGGPVLGAGAIVLLQDLLSTFTRRWMFILGVLYILVVLYAPDGIVGILRGWRERRTPAAGDAR
ncbi:MAG: branched-chain amino acid ABC transporter permease [Armatimonadota bacterium]